MRPEIGRRKTRSSKAELAQDFVDIETPKYVFAGVSLMKSRGPVGVILLAFVRIGQYCIGLADFLELGLVLLVAAVLIWVVL